MGDDPATAEAHGGDDALLRQGVNGQHSDPEAAGDFGDSDATGSNHWSLLASSHSFSQSRRISFRRPMLM
jgi:hypothetical protein